MSENNFLALCILAMIITFSGCTVLTTPPVAPVDLSRVCDDLFRLPQSDELPEYLSDG